MRIRKTKQETRTTRQISRREAFAEANDYVLSLHARMYLGF